MNDLHTALRTKEQADGTLRWEVSPASSAHALHLRLRGRVRGDGHHS